MAKKIATRRLIGPRMVIASPIFSGPAAPGGMIAFGNEDEARQAVRKVKEDGADFVKVYNYVQRNAYIAIADECKKQGIPFAGHVPEAVTVAEASDAGQKSIEHCNYILMACAKEGEKAFKKKYEVAHTTKGVRG